MQASLPSRDLVLIGAGHTNLHVVRMWRMQPIPDVSLTLVSPFSRATYSGMLPGTLAGLYEPDEMEIDLYRFTASCGARLIVEPMIAFDPERRRVRFADRPPIRYDVASIGIGSVPSAGPVWRNHPDVLGIKPMQEFLARLNQKLDEVQAEEGRPLRIAIVGAGAAGVEVAFCLDTHLKNRGVNALLTLIDSGDSILPGYASRTIHLAEAELERRSISRVIGRRVKELCAGELRFESGDPLPADLVVWATGAAPPPVLEQIALPKADDGFLAVRQSLQTTGDFPVFVVGDTATLVENPVRKAGVYAVREGPVLWENLQRIFAGRELTKYEPQRGFLSMLATGDGRAIAQYKGLAIHGSWVWKWKDWIDRKFMRKYQDYRPMTAEMMAEREKTDQTAKEPLAMRCRGCGGKVGANVLSAALGRLDVPPAPLVRQGLNPPDDAAVLDTGIATPNVLSVDFFHAFMDDPYIVGRVAALNSLSDLWATGARPLGAMALVTLPEGEAKQQAELLYQLLAGGLHELAAADAALLGGHTTAGDELLIGYSVVGDLEDTQPFAKGGLKPGDRLILTKPLGTGVLLAANMQSACRAAWMDTMLPSMLRSNAAAAQIAREQNLSAVTDVTGFGLAGHLLEMLDAGGVSAELSLDKIPLLDGFRELSADGIRSTLDPANRQAEDRMEFASPGSHRHPGFDALFDPQTSGGLLIGVPADRAAALLDRLRGAGCGGAAIIGRVTESSTPPMVQLMIGSE